MKKGKGIIIKSFADYEISANSNDEAFKLDYEFFNNFTSEHTRKSYRTDIRQFIKFINKSFPNLENILSVDRFHIVSFRNWMTDLEYAPKTINRKLASASSYYDFLVEKEFIKFNPCTSVKRPKQVVQNETNDLTDDEVETLLNIVDKEASKLHRAIVYLFFSTGIRKSELINLKMKDYKLNGLHRVIVVKAKGGKILIKALHPVCVQVLEDYFLWMKDQYREIENEEWIFQPTKNPYDKTELIKKIRPKSIDYIISKYVKKAGITKKISPHSARATYIGSALEGGEELLKVSQEVGHASVKTTEVYNKRRMKLKDSPTYNLGFMNKRKVS